MLEWKIRLDIVQYVARGSPKLSAEKIASYVPKDEASSADRKFLSSFSVSVIRDSPWTRDWLLTSETLTD